MLTSDTNNQIPRYIADVYRQWKRAEEAVVLSEVGKSEYQLTRSEANILSLIQCTGADLTQAKLVELSLMDKSQLTRVLRKLEDLGLIIKKMGEDDRRIKYIELTDKASAIVASLASFNEKLLDEIKEDIDEDDLGHLTQILGHIREKISYKVKQLRNNKVQQR